MAQIIRLVQGDPVGQVRCTQRENRLRCQAVANEPRRRCTASVSPKAATDLVGKSRMIDMTLTGRVYQGQEAVDLGLAQYITAGSSIVMAMELAHKVAQWCGEYPARSPRPPCRFRRQKRGTFAAQHLRLSSKWPPPNQCLVSRSCRHNRDE